MNYHIIHAKNYKIVFKTVRVVQRTLLVLFSRYST